MLGAVLVEIISGKGCPPSDASENGFTRLGFGMPVPKSPEHLRGRGGPDQVDTAHHFFTVVEMIVVIRQAGDDRGAPEIDQTRIRACEPLDCSIGPDGDILLAPHRKRLRDRKALIDRNDLAVIEDCVRRSVALLRDRTLRNENAQQHQ